jgi:hypothetical protein
MKETTGLLVVGTIIVGCFGQCGLAALMLIAAVVIEGD